MKLTKIKIWLLGILQILLFTPLAHAGDWIVGSGKSDVTGPAADLGMVGYGDTGQTTKGIHSRLWSRAFYIEKPGTGQKFVFVSADLQSITQGVKQGVINKLKKKYGSQFSDANVMLTATHTHVGPGGYDHYVMLNMSALGYDSDNYNAITNGIYDSIVNAVSTAGLGNIYVSQDEFDGININRNPQPYNQNNDRHQYSSNTNKNMVQLKLVKDGGTELGLINWFAVHNVSYGTSQRQISGDNKGAASQYFENWKTPQNPDFVAAFANSNLGDSSPNVCGPGNGCGANDQASMELSGSKQFEAAKQLYQSGLSPLTGNLEYRHQYVYLPGYEVSNTFTGSGDTEICEGVVGWSMTAGSSWDGPSDIPGVFEGMTVDNEGSSWNKNRNLFANAIAGYPIFALMNGFSDATLFNQTADDPCQYPKPTFVNRKVLGAELYTAHIPFQLVTIGNLAIIASAGEMTTMAGRRLQNQVLQTLASEGIDTAVIAGLANAYHGYITTPEEYQMQHYEGGHTIYGPNTLAAYLQVYNELALAIKNEWGVSAGPTPPDLSNDQIIKTIGVVYDDKRLWESFGKVTKDAKSSYETGKQIKVTFRSGHPRNNFTKIDTFVEVQRKVNGNWQTWLSDDDLETKFIWRRDTSPDCLACSYVDAIWIPAADTPSGSYRIKHKGYWKSGWDRKLRSYSGKSRTFTIK